ncbi:MAG: 4-hydroxybenzoate octaprenyltransferase, partial [Pirellulales bacterium]
MQLRKQLEMIRFSHTVFALPFALLAAVMAWTAQPRPPWRWLDLAGIVLCMVAARSAAMAFNRIVDRKMDARNPRTADRHLPSGQLSVASAVGFAAACSALFVTATLLFLPHNPLPVFLSVPVLLFLLGYSYSKRFTALAHFWLGAALMLAPICAWIAIRGNLVLADLYDLLPAVILGGSVMMWVAGFDMIYACMDVDFDRQENLKSIPNCIGISGALRLSAVCHVGTIILLAILPLEFPILGWIYWCGVGL